MSQPSCFPALLRELRDLRKEPVEGFVVNPDQDDISVWKVSIFGPPGTPYQGGYFKATIVFPLNYPYSPPKLTFVSKIWHPNVYENGEICISILHPPNVDPLTDELACERWNPTQNVRTILLSVISLLNEPNVSSPANVDAAKMYRAYVSTNGKADDYSKISRKQVEQSREAAKSEGVFVPETLEEYLVKNAPESDPLSDMLATIDYYDDDDDEF